MPRTTPMDAGERDRLITVQQVTDGTGSSGFPTETWATLAQVYARRVDIGGRERFAAGIQTQPYDTRWETAYRSDLDPDEIEVGKKRRIVYKGRVYDITHAAEIGRRDGIEFFTLAGGLAT
jgi:SPP1 family predicted phage head-tail adaptor